MNPHLTIKKIKEFLASEIKKYQKEIEKTQQSFTNLKNREFQSIIITEKKLNSKKEYKIIEKKFDNVNQMNFFDRNGFERYYNNQMTQTSNELTRLQKVYSKISDLFNLIDSNTFIKPVNDILDLLYAILIICEPLNLALEEILDVMLLAIYETGKYYKNHPKKYQEIQELNNFLMTNNEKILLTNVSVAFNLAESLDKDGNFIPILSIEKIKEYFSMIFIKNVIDSEELTTELKDIRVDFDSIINYFEIKYQKALELQSQKEINISPKEKEINNIKNSNLRKKEKEKFHNEKQALKQLEEYVKDGSIIKKCYDINYFRTLLSLTPLNEKDQLSLLSKMQQLITSDSKSQIYIPSILKENYQKSIYMKILNSDDETIKYYLEEIITADNMYQEASLEDKNDLEEYIASIISAICYTLNLNEDTLKLQFSKKD